MKTKRNVLILTIILTMGLAMVAVNAGEVEDGIRGGAKGGRPVREPLTVENFEEKINERIEGYDVRMNERLANLTQQHLERVEKVTARQAKSIGFITEWAPELVGAYQANFDEHILVHGILFSTNYSKHEEYHNETMIGLEALKVELVLAVEEGTMTVKEGAEAFKAYTVGRRDEYVELKEAYRAEIEPLNAENEASNLIIKGLREEIKVAIEVGDTETVSETLAEILTYKDIHNGYDYAKLAILETY